jgi:hypothetical protein
LAISKYSASQIRLRNPDVGQAFLPGHWLFPVYSCEEDFNMRTLAAIFLISGSAFCADQTPTVASLVNQQISIVEGEIVSLAQAMPADKYNFRPANGEFKTVRTFALQVKHVATSNYVCASAALEEKPPVEVGKDENGSDSIATKEQIVQYLKDSFAYAHKAASTLTDKNQLDQVPSPFGNNKIVREGAALCPSWHGFDHYGQMVVYARMNSVIPPASR